MDGLAAGVRGARGDRGHQGDAWPTAPAPGRRAASRWRWGPGDSPALHAADTLAASDGLADPEAVRILTNEGPDRIRELLALGAIFDRGPDGRLRFGLEAAHTRPRIMHAGGDRTGAVLIACLPRSFAQHPDIEILEHTEARRC